MPTFQTFKDLSIAFKPHPVTGDVATKKDVAAIRQSVANLLYTKKTERPFASRIGTNLHKLLFEPLSVTTAGLIAAEIKDVLLAYEPRILIEELTVDANLKDDGFEVFLAFRIVGRADQLLQLDLFLERP